MSRYNHPKRVPVVGRRIHGRKIIDLVVAWETGEGMGILYHIFFCVCVIHSCSKVSWNEAVEGWMRGVSKFRKVVSMEMAMKDGRRSNFQ